MNAQEIRTTAARSAARPRRLADLRGTASEAAKVAGVVFAVGTGLDGSSSVLYTINNFGSSPAAQAIGTIQGKLLDIGIDPTSQKVYFIDSDSNFAVVDLDALTYTRLGVTAPVNALVFDAGGQAYGWGDNRVLYRINKANGAETPIGDTGFASGGDLAFDLDGTLYGTTLDQLIRIDPATGHATLVGSLGFSGAFGLIIDSAGTMYAGRGSEFDNIAEIYRVNKRTGSASLVGSVANASDSLAGLALVGNAPSNSLFLNNARFRVDVTWHTANGQQGAGIPVQLTSDTGYFWFFNPANVEMVIKVLNGCELGGHYWVFAGGLTNVRTSINVTDTLNGQVKTYNNPQGTSFQPIQDTSAFATCP